MNTSRPKVSVIMGMRNAEPFLEEAVGSILRQEFEDFEFLVIDDGSNDRSFDIVHSLKDERIKLHRQVEPTGLTRVLNFGLSLAAGEYIARMDADDVAVKSRLKRQVAFLDENPAIGICGMWYERFDGIESAVVRCPTSDADIKCALFFGNPIAHGTICLRRTVLAAPNTAYDPDFVRAQDYDLWDRLSERTQFAVLPSVGLRYRIHDEQVGTVESETQRNAATTVMNRAVKRLVQGVTTRELELHQSLLRCAPEPSTSFLEEVSAWGEKLATRNRSSGRYPADQFEKYLADRWFRLCSRLSAFGPAVWWTFEKSHLARAVDARRAKSLRLLVKSAVRAKGRSGIAKNRLEDGCT